MTEPPMTTTEAAATLGVSTDRIKQLIREGVLDAEKFGAAWMIAAPSVHAYTRNRRPAGRPKSDASE